MASLMSPNEAVSQIEDPWRFLPHTFAMHLSDNKWVPYTYLVLISHLIAHAVSKGYGRIIVELPPRHGKLIADSTPVLTMEGWKRHGDLRVGDHVFGRDGAPVTVQGVSSPDIADHMVEFSNGETILAHEKHEWVVNDRSCHKEKILETGEMSRCDLSYGGERGHRGHRNRFQVDGNVTLQIPECKLPIHPYFFGVWLGDGRSSSLEFCGDKKDEAIVEKIAMLGYSTSSRWTHKTTGVKYYYYKGVKEKLKKLNVLNNKHIPDSYLFSSVKQRLELLAGLVDTDGSRDKAGRYRISTCNERLAYEIKTIVHSLGENAYIMKYLPVLSSSGIQGKKNIYQIGFNLSYVLPVALKRKNNERFKNVRQKRSIVKIEKVSIGEPGRCIQVEGGVYLVGKTLIPTHNSWFISRWIPAWFLANWPELYVILTTYEANFAAHWGRQVRNILRENEVALGKKYISLDSSAASQWDTLYGGGMITAGVGGPITGKGFHLGIIDDPHKNWQEAMSASIRKTIIDWYDSTFYTRAEPPGGVIVVLHTRWHDEDLIGYLTSKSKGEEWVVIRFPAIAEDDSDILGRKIGEALCPDRFDENALARIKLAVGGKIWAGLYQQRPSISEGNIFKRTWWKRYNRCAEGMFRIQSWDTAAKKGENTAFTVCQTWDRGQIGYYMRDQWRNRVEFPDLIRQIVFEYEKWRPNVVLIEDKSSGQQAIQTLQRSTTIPIIPVSPVNDKETRAIGVSPVVEGGKVYIPESAPWVEDFINRSANFPNTAFADEIDALSQALSYLVATTSHLSMVHGMTRQTFKLLENFR